MNYCILVTISRNSISFRYNRIDGDNRFVDMMQDGEREMPFAIECAGSDFIIGKSALEAATSNLAQNAFADIFNTCKSMRTFRFAGRDEQLNKLPYYAIKNYVGKILSNKFYGQEGTIDSNISRIPLVFLFAPEIDTDKKRLIVSPFENGGFQNLCSISYYQLLLPTLLNTLPEVKKMKAMVMASVDNEDLLLQTFSLEQFQEIGNSILVTGQGRDPRLNQAADMIWANLFSYNYKEREPETQILLDAAARFLNSNEKSVNDSLCMSDGSMQPYMLDRSCLDMPSVGENSRLISHELYEFLSEHDLGIQQCQIVLVGKAASDYFENIFNQMQITVPVIKVTEKEKGQMLDRLLVMVKQVNYEVRTLFSDDIATTAGNTSFVKSVLKENIHERTPLPTVDKVVPSKDDKRKVRTDIADIKGKLRSKDTFGAYQLCKDLQIWLEQKGFIDWNAELENILKEINLAQQAESKVTSKVSPQIDMRSFGREVSRKLAEIKAHARLGRINEAVDALDELIRDLQKKNVKEFDAKIQAIVSDYGLKRNTENVAKATSNSISAAEVMLKNEKFAEAKRQFAAEGNSEMAQVCSSFIRAKRKMMACASGIDSVRRTHNAQSIKNVIKELEGSLLLYRKYGVNSNDLEELIEQYKMIK